MVLPERAKLNISGAGKTRTIIFVGVINYGRVRKLPRDYRANIARGCYNLTVF